MPFGAPFLSAVPLARGSPPAPVRARGVSQTAVPMIAQPRRFPSALGQFSWNPPGTLPPVSTGEAGLTMRCYRCGINPPTLMLPSMASFNPSCVEVDGSLCAEQQADIDEAQSGGGAFTQPPPTGTTPETAPHVIAGLRVFEPMEMKPLQGASVRVLSVNPYDGSTTQIASGTTNADGRYAFLGNLAYFRGPTSLGAAPGNIRFIVTPGPGTPSFPEAMTETRNQGEMTMRSFIAVCVAGTPSVICEVAKGQAMWMTVYEQQLIAWGSSPQGHNIAGDQAHAAVMNGLRPQDSRLQRYWMMTYSWWIGALDIPPKEWPVLLDRSHQTFKIFAGIPFPRWPGIEDYFTRCAGGVPFAMAAGPEGENYNIGNPRLYTDRFSNYFPNTDEQIEKHMAAAYSNGLQQIIKCIIHKIKQKQKELERTARAMSIISMGIVVAFSPFLIAAGPSGVAVLATEAYEFVAMQNQGVGAESYGVTAALAAAMIAVGDVEFVVAALEPMIGDLTAEMDPLAAQAVSAAMPQIIDVAVDTVSGPLGIGSGAEVGGGAVGGMAVAMAIKVIAGIAKNYLANRMEEFQDAAQGAQMAANDVMAFAEGQEAGPHFKPFVQWVVETLDLMRIFNDAIDQFLDEFMNALNQGDEQGGGITVVDSDDGGGPVIVPTDPEGTPTDPEGDPIPTDVEGNPLPGAGPTSGFPAPAPDIAGPSTLETVAAVGGGAAALILIGSAVL